MHDQLVPVASPALLKAKPLKRIDDLARFTRLHTTLRADKWSHWLAACGAAELCSARSMKLQDT